MQTETPSAAKEPALVIYGTDINTAKDTVISFKNYSHI